MEFVEHSVVINYIPVVYLLTVNVIEVTANAIILIPSGCPLSISECVFFICAVWLSFASK